jgi:hypothetical protein
MWVINAKYVNPTLDPEFEDGIKFIPKTSPIFRLEVQREDVLIFLGWILGVLDGSVRAYRKPVWMLGYPWMVR